MRQMLEKNVRLILSVRFKDRRQANEQLSRALIENIMARLKDLLDSKSSVSQFKGISMSRTSPVPSQPIDHYLAYPVVRSI